ncbi:auxilin-like protein 1 [Panicum hallii]|uniref:auxilin-like protein 1 n=1 Tax=Panicum hallii TaxID=206008 RepID=UPI000DF4EF4F|nr:auxilin-like protein 1 [Panicum hallii]
MGSEEGSAPCNQEDQKSPESTNRGRNDLDAKCDTTCDEVGSESFPGDEVILKAASYSATRTTINLKEEPASSSEMYTRKQHSVQNHNSAMSQTSCSVPDFGETGEISNRRERELRTQRSTSEEKSRASKFEEKDTTARISKAEHGPSPLETSHGLTKSAECPLPVSAETWKKDALGVQRAKERENITRVDNTTEKDNGSSRKTQETKESERRLQKERELAEEKERRKLEEEERERERKKDRLAVERATREAHERAFAEAREKAEKMAQERITAARQRASAEAREKEERASAEAAIERATREARIKAERAAVERATTEARERAIEKAKAEKALAEARERRERYRSSFKEGFKSTNQDTLALTDPSRGFAKTCSMFFEIDLRTIDAGSGQAAVLSRGVNVIEHNACVVSDGKLVTKLLTSCWRTRPRRSPS